MASFRVPYPADPAERDALFRRVTAFLGRHGTYEGTPDAGTFQGHSPVGRFAGSYRAIDDIGDGQLEITIAKKPMLIPASLVEHEVRKFLIHA